MRNRNSVLWVAVLATAMLVSGQVLADTVIGVNFCDRWPTPHMGGKTFDGLSNWTDSFPIDGSGATNNGTGLVILGTNGLVMCNWSSPNTWAAGSEATPEQQLYRVYLDDGTAPRVTISGLSAWLVNAGLGAYTVRIYHSTDTSNASFRPVDIKAGDTTLQTVQETNRWYTDGGSRAYVDSGILTADTITLAPQTRSGTGTGSARATIAGVKITGIGKFMPLNPAPAIGVEAPVNQVLTWEQAPAANGLGVTYKVYFGDDANDLNPTYYALSPVKITTDNPTDFFFDPTPDMANSKTYYWRVDTVEPNIPTPVVHTGPEWWFTTQPPSARIETHPVSMTVPAGTAQAVFTVAGINIASYQWFKDGAALPAAPALYSGQDGPTLTILDVQVADEGFYHCEGDNSLNQPSVSTAAQLLTRRLVGWWKLDGDLTDSVGEAVAGAVTHDGTSVDPNFIPIGKDGGALQFYGDADSLATFPGSANFYNFYPRGYTVSAWVNMPTKTSGAWGAYVCKQGLSPSRGFILTHQGGGQAVHTLRQSYNDLGSNTDVDDNTWHLVVGTYDAAAKQGKVYVDGVLKNQATNAGTPTGSAADLIFGAEIADATNAPYIGLLDDVRIWSYVVDPVAVAMLYADFNPGIEVCVSIPEYDVSGPEGVSDCRVNVYDFVPFAEAWLNCNIVPTCLP
jgi:hypothetical protein